MATKRDASHKPFVDDATLHQWAESGSKRIRTKLSEALTAFAVNKENDADDSDLSHLLYELVWVVVQAKLPRHDVVSVLKKADLAAFPEACDAFMDLLWIIGNEIEVKEVGRERHTSPEWQQLCRLVKSIAEEEIVPPLSLKSSLEFDLLHGAGLTSEPQVIRKKILRINTKSLYTQMKYNLLREESEGFSKVLGLLHTGVTPDQLEASKTDLLSLIGYFDLDANRVLDLVLDAYEMHTENDCFAELLGAFKKESLPHVIGFKFQFYKRPDVAETLVTPRSLYRLAATLIRKKLLDLDALLPHLAPSKEEIVKQYMVRVKKLEDEARSYGKVNLAAKSDDSAEKAAEDAATAGNVDEHNQVYGLIVGMLEIGSEASAFEMIRWFQGRGVNPLAYKPLTMQLCTLVNALIESLYEPLSLKKLQLIATTTTSKQQRLTTKSSAAQYNNVKPLTTSDELVKVVFPILEMLGAQLHHDQLLLSKLLRIIAHLLEDESKKKAPATEGADGDDDNNNMMTKAKELIVKSFLPTLTLQVSNPSSAFQLWELIKLYPFDQRYRMYQQWQEAYTSSPEMKLVEAQVVQNTRKVMRRLTADRAKPSARSLTHVAHSNPLIVFRTMLRQIQSYDNLIQPVVESFKFITPLGMDVLSFVLVSELAKSRQSMKSDGTNISLWLASLASFSGSFYRKYPNVELAGLLQYLIQRLQNWESVDLVVLSELLSKMGSCISFEDISLSQLEAQAGGPHLWHEPSDPKLMNRRAIPRLRDALVKRNLALPLCLLICQMRGRIEFQENSPLTHLKLLGRVYDTCQMTLSQLLQFLNGVVDPLVYTKMLPPIRALVQDYHIPAELVMTLCRPAIRFDDPVLKRAPRSIHATSSSSNSNGADANGSSSRRTWFMNSPELVDDVRQALAGPDPTKDPFMGMTKDLYVTFWSLILYDIHVPFSQYESEIVRLRNSLTAAGGIGALSTSERKKFKEKTSNMIDKLTTEQKDQVAHRKRVFERLEEKKHQFFTREAPDNLTAVTELLQKCVIPRALLSPEDALFCAKFMERIHYINTPEFSTLQYFDKINLKLPSMVLCVTEREAGNFGIFVKETLTLLFRWYQSAVTYEEDALHGKSGFSIDLNDPKKKLAYRQYKQLYAKWHKWMAKVYSTTLASDDYMPIRNTLVILTKIIDVFPSSKSTAESMLVIVETLTKEEREDIKIMAKRYFALLMKRKSTLVEDKMLAVAVPKVKEAAKPVPATDKEEDTRDEARDDGEKEQRRSESRSSETVAFEKKAERESMTSSSSRDRDRDRKRVLRQDLESGEISSPPPPPMSGSSSSRRSSDRSSSAALPPVEATSSNNKDSSRSSSSRLKRRDSDRASAEESNSSSRHHDDKRGRRNESTATTTRDASPGGKPPMPLSSSSSSRGGSGSKATTDAAADSSAGRKRDRSRERRSRSADGRRNGRDRDRGGEKEVRSSSSNRNQDTQKDNSSENVVAASDNDSRKRQRVENSEAALRRQLTEKKDQGQRREAREPREPREQRNEGAKPSESATSRGDSERGSTGQQSQQQQPARKIVSLVSRKRERDPTSLAEDEGGRQTPILSAPALAGADNDRDRGNADDRGRKRDLGRGGSGGGSNNRGGDSDQNQKRGLQDEKKKLRHRKGRDDASGSGGGGGSNKNNNQTQQEHRDQQSNNGNRVNDRNRGGGQGRSNDESGRDGNDERNQSNNNSGGNGRRREHSGNNNDRRGRR
uniref:THO complex subunit 2 n=1 Tax=Globisporangium ultimum (strain ATCC 200006 / CBS 805.95 / DAOM BR144) TaxID=431595 RepID=K3W895_GLOUD